MNFWSYDRENREFDLDNDDPGFSRYLKSPLPIPTFDQFIGAGTLLSNSLDDDTYNELLNNNEYGREWGNLFTLGTMHVVPAGDLADDFIEWCNKTLTTFPQITTRTHEDAGAAIDYINKNLNERAFVLIDLGSTTYNPDNLDFTIRMNYTTLPNTSRVTRWIARGLSRRYQRYYLSGFLTVQRTLADYVFATSGCDQTNPLPGSLDYFSMPMPTPDFEQNIFYTAVGYLLGLAISMGFLYPMSRLVKAVVEEKESRMKETMLILGVKPWVHWMSWIVTAYITFTIIAFLVSHTISTTFLPNTDRTLMFMYIWLFCASVIGFSFFVASFFSKAKLAAIIGPVALFASLMPRWIFYGSNRYEAENSKMLASLLPCTAFAFGADILSDYEYAEIGVQSFNMDEGAYSFRICLIMMAFDAVFYFFLSWYTDQIVPGQFGVSKNPFFLFFPSYWSGVIDLLRGSDNTKYTAVFDDRETSANYESVGDGKPMVQIQNLVKQYSGAEKRAVDGLSLTMYENQIMCLLGHNGAGKTTTISVLTGLYPPTSGDCVIYGKRISTDLLNARHSMGICPQHNVLFQELTVREHIVFFNLIKSRNPSKEDVEKAAADVGLGDKLETLSGALSGGMKRKLSVAVSLCGDPKFLLLDEPTSGMDPYSRRATWELLRKRKNGRVTLLTTHFMDEADILSDRIAVMQTGKLQCVGSSTFLKKRFGLGYNITFVTEKPGPETTEGIASFLKQFVPSVDIINVAGKEVSFRLPSGSEGRFPEMFKTFELAGGAKESLQIGGYGISNTTLEEVFIRLADEGVDTGNSLSIGPGDLDDISVGSTPQTTPRNNESRSLISGEPLGKQMSMSKMIFAVGERLSNAATSTIKATRIADEEHDGQVELSALGDFEQAVRNRGEAEILPANFFGQVKILLRKRLDVQKRDLKASFFMLVLPALLVSLVLLILTLEVPLAGPPMNLSADLYTYTNSKAFKKPAETQILVGGGGGSGVLGSYREYEAFNKLVDGANINERADWEWDESLRTSSDLSQEMLDSYNDHDFALRFGAYALNDTIPYSLRIDWPEIRYNLKNENWFPSGDNGELPIDGDITALFEIFTGPKDSDGKYRFSFDTLQLEDVLVNNLEVNLTTKYNVSEVIDDLEDGVKTLLNISNATETSSETEDIQKILEEQLLDLAIENFVNGLSGDNKTLTGQEILDSVVEAAGGDPNDVENPGWFTVSMTSVIVEAETRKVTIKDFTVIIGGGKDGKDGSGTKTELGDVTFTLPSDWRSTLIDLLPSEYYREDSFINSTYSMLHNSSSPHAVASFTQTLFQSIYNQCPSISDAARFSITNHPLPLTVTQALEIKTILSLFASLFILIPYCYIPAAFVVFVVKEKSCKSKHLQLVSGVSVESYWLSTYLFDMFLYSILTIMIMTSFFIYGQGAAEVFVGSATSMLCTFLITFLYGASALPFAYLMSRSFSNHTTAQISVMGLFFITGFVCVNSYFIMSSIDTTKATAATMVHYFRFFPPYNVGEALINLSTSFYLRTILGYQVYPFDYKVCGMNLLNMFALSIFYSFLVVVIEISEVGGGGGVVGTYLRRMGKFIGDFKLRLNGVRTVNGRLIVKDGLDDNNGVFEEDEDVATERKNVDENFHNVKTEEAIVIKDLWKVYPPTVGFCKNPPKRAVRGLTACVKKGEIFGLLGVNGAGKTTTLGILTGETTATSGSAYVAGYDVGSGGSGLSLARRKIGFCPQEDPLLELMTCRETLRMFAKLRGMPGDYIEEMIERLMQALGLTLHVDKCAGALSGGNKRKLSLGVALIGDPQVLFIDEASSGMDPVARRKMWDLLSHLAKNRSVVLTTHSMEEAEALCSNIAIMVSGRMRCLGSPQHLKTRYVDGLNIDITCEFGCDDEDIKKVERYVESHMAAKLAERHGRFLRYSLSYKDGGGRNESGGLSKTFSILQQGKEEEKDLKILDYSISQYSLESVFINLAKEGDGAVVGGSADVLGDGRADVHDI
ncbi:hypothetical protein TL16_g01967 [Triparma laevis f. inornata]|uniref:ABC transporter domain-containing protein n=1 Tax=Triparma laevis f. inornata TaxID=1714386 RepID=A0A9W7DTH5_9STRA|nr:hypothetical protein TL16_g01967 [Triparma laevis f. inornata]